MSGFVLDCSVAVAWFLRDEASDRAEGVLLRLREETALAPQLWPYELANALWSAQRRGRIEEAGARLALETAGQLPIAIRFRDASEIFSGLPPLARRFGLSVYDAAYLDLALGTGLPLATLDDRLARAAGECGVGVLL